MRSEKKATSHNATFYPYPWAAKIPSERKRSDLQRLFRREIRFPSLGVLLTHPQDTGVSSVISQTQLMLLT